MWFGHLTLASRSHGILKAKSMTLSRSNSESSRGNGGKMKAKSTSTMVAPPPLLGSGLTLPLFPALP
jgi:hypothetical protein